MSKQEIKQKIKEAAENDPLKNDIKKVSIFGSYIHGNFKSDSYVDVLIEFTPTANRVRYRNLQSVQADQTDYPL